jgi:hypothetical protein
VFTQEVAQAIATDYSNYGVSSRFETAEDVIRNIVTTTFSSLIIKTKISPDNDSMFKDRSHFARQVDLDAEQDFKDILFDVIETKHKKGPEEFEFKHKDIQVLITPEEARQYTDGEVAGAFSVARDMRKSDILDLEADENPDEGVEQADLTEEEKYVNQVERYAEMIASGKQFDWQDLFPYFGFKNVSGIRQWYLKKVDPKIRILSYKQEDPNTGEVTRSAMNELLDNNMILISKRMAEVLRNELIPKLESDAAKGKLKQRNFDPKKNKLKQVDETKMLRALKNNVLQLLDTINQQFDEGASYEQIANETDFLRSTVGGYVLRNLGSFPFDAVIKEFSERWAEDIKSVINQIRKKHNPEAGADLDDNKLDSLVEYWTGLKGDPDFDNKNKAAKNLSDAGITPEAYIEIAVNAQNSWEDLEYETDETQPGADLADFFMSEIDNLLNKKNSKSMINAIKKAYKEMMQELEDSGRQRQAGM